MAAKTPLELAAREAVLTAIQAAHDRFNERERALLLEGKVSEADGAHTYALWCLRALIVEEDDPPPKAWK